MQSSFWLNNPLILINSNNINQVWPTKEMDANEKLNSISRLVIILSILGYLATKNIRILVTCCFTLIAIAILYYAQQQSNNKNLIKSSAKEGFETLSKSQLEQINFTKPSENNPVMNVLIPEIQDNPNRPQGQPAYNPIVEQDINKKTQEFVVNQFDDKQGINDKLFKDLGDKFEFDMSMHQWYTTPNTTIPNDQKTFAEFCYGDMISCKEGDSFASIRSMPPHRIDGGN